MKIAAAQISLKLGDLEANTKKLLQKLEQAYNVGADIVVFPEMSDTGYDNKIMIDLAQNWESGTIPELCKAAEKYKLNVVAGVSERVEDGVYNSMAIIDRNGKIIGKYRKTHLCTVEPFFEHKLFKAGDKLCQLELENINCGFINCYEIRFPEIVRTLSIQGVKILFVPAAFPMVRLQHWKILLEARAIENQIFIVACNRVGLDNKNNFCGLTTIIDPYGTTTASGSAIHEKLIVGEIDMEMINTVRSQIQVHQDRRSDLYNL